MNEVNTVILLTACINPGGMAYTSLQDVESRIQQYKKALHFYLEFTQFKILVVENTLSYFADRMEYYILSGRLEYLTFEGNNYDKSLGKGFGEALIIRYALENSLLLREAEYVIKITGRLIVPNIKKLYKLGDFSTKDGYMISCNIRPSKKLATSVFFIASKRFLESYFVPRINEIDDKHHKWFEHILFDAVEECKKDKGRCFIFPIPIKLEGISGTTSKAYRKVRLVDYILSCVASILYNQLGYEHF